MSLRRANRDEGSGFMGSVLACGCTIYRVEDVEFKGSS